MKLYNRYLLFFIRYPNLNRVLCVLLVYIISLYLLKNTFTVYASEPLNLKPYEIPSNVIKKDHSHIQYIPNSKFTLYQPYHPGYAVIPSHSPAPGSVGGEGIKPILGIKLCEPYWMLKNRSQSLIPIVSFPPKPLSMNVDVVITSQTYFRYFNPFTSVYAESFMFKHIPFQLEAHLNKLELKTDPFYNDLRTLSNQRLQDVITTFINSSQLSFIPAEDPLAAAVMDLIPYDFDNPFFATAKAKTYLAYLQAMAFHTRNPIFFHAYSAWQNYIILNAYPNLADTPAYLIIMYNNNYQEVSDFITKKNQQ